MLTLVATPLSGMVNCDQPDMNFRRLHVLTHNLDAHPARARIICRNIAIPLIGRFSGPFEQVDVPKVPDKPAQNIARLHYL